MVKIIFFSKIGKTGNLNLWSDGRNEGFEGL